jgi:hypothetical protein
MDLPMTDPRPPAELWGLWTVTQENPEGFWWNHAHGYGGANPMTFESRDDAEATLENEEEELDDGESMMVASLLVAPPVPA